ncbi:MAG TPA: DUF4056 domain-containing protein [Draconibacterium sp.]|nr:DUF4056 domain-containing protein [Draconibacterium sp.]
MNIALKNFYLFIITLAILFGSFYSNAKAPVLTSRELSVAPPRIIRTCCGFGVEIGIAAVPFAKKTDITSREIMGTHTYMGGKNEQNGNIYTRRGGFLDMGHLRDCADWTAYLYNLIKASQTDPYYSSIELRNEGGAKSLRLNVPKDFTDEQIIQLAGKISYDMSLWHEISTWFGASYVPLVPERFSSFSPEDMYSNLMGVHLGIRAIKSNLAYNEAMTTELNKMLDLLESVYTEEETYNAMLKVNELWYTNEKKYPNKKIVLKRYIELDSDLSPWLVPGEESKLPPYLLRRPDKELSKYYELSLKLNFRFPVDSILPKKNDRIITQQHFDIFVDYIQKEINHELTTEEQKELKKEEKFLSKKNSKNK